MLLWVLCLFAVCGLPGLFFPEDSGCEKGYFQKHWWWFFSFFPVKGCLGFKFQGLKTHGFKGLGERTHGLRGWVTNGFTTIGFMSKGLAINGLTLMGQYDRE